MADEVPTAADASQDSAAKPSQGSPVPARTIAFLVLSFALAAVCVAFALQFFVAERLPELTEARLEAAMDLWLKNGPSNYIMDIELKGAQPGAVHVEVLKKEVENETRNGRTPGRWTWDAWSVPGLFDTLTEDLEIAKDPHQQIDAATGTKWRLRCEFDPKFGYPLQYHRLVTGGPEVFWRVTEFQPK